MKRRAFLESSGKLGLAAAAMSVARGAYAAGTDLLTVGLIGCGGRGRGVMANRLSVQDNCKVIALADVFEENVRNAKEAFESLEDPRFAVDDDHLFSGFDAYKKVIDLCDQVLIVTTPAFRPVHYRYAVEKGKSIFMEKPCCVDAPGYRSLLESNEIADQKGLTVVVGYQRHYQPEYQELIEQIAGGAIGEVLNTRVYWNSTGIWERPRQAGDTEMKYQIRNWYHFPWLSGDNICEQHCHNIDIGNWMHCQGDFKGPLAHPVKVNAMGGRQVRRFPFCRESGYRFDHFFCEYTYADGSQMYSQSRQQEGTWPMIGEIVYGTKGIGGAGWLDDYKGNPIWRYQGEVTYIYNPAPKSYEIEQEMLVKWTREGTPHNDGWHAAHSSMTAVFGMLAAYSGQELQWDDVITNGKAEFPPESVTSWDQDPPIHPDTVPPAQPEEGQFIYENSVPLPGFYKWDN